MNFISGFGFGFMFFGLLVMATSKHTNMYREGVEDVYKDAYKNGLAIREIDKNDKIIYRWKELHSIGYED